MENPFETGQVKNYLLLYAAVVVIMVLFFIASTLFHDDQVIEQRVFNTEINSTTNSEVKEDLKALQGEAGSKKFKLLDKI